MQRKPDAEAISDFFHELSKEKWLGWKRRAWPRHCYHVTDVRNAVSILRVRRLLSRDRALGSGALQNENASREILAGTNPKYYGYVRLYFRPRTPTFYRNEGLRPTAERFHGAHCPVPVAFVFDVSDIAGCVGVEFSDGNLASRESSLGHDAAFLRTLDFGDIYHDERPSDEVMPHIVRARQSEIVIPDELSLDALRHVIVRSDADRQTLRTLLWDAGTQLPSGIDGIEIDHNTFFCRWSYLRRVVLNGERVVAHFDSSVKEPGVFAFRWRWRSPEGGVAYEETETREANGIIMKLLPAGLRDERVRLDLYLDDALAFTGVLRQTPSMTLLR